MNKVTKGVVAAGMGATLLVGGAGTLAYWTEDATVNGGVINTGHLNLTNQVCTSWILDAAENAPTTYTAGDPIVPGDVLTRTCTYDIDAEGNHLRAEVDIDTPTFDAAGDDFGGTLTASVTALEVDGDPLATEFTELNNTVSADIEVVFASTAGNTTQDLATVLEDLTITATQVHD